MSTIAQAYQLYQAGRHADALNLLHNRLKNIPTDAKALHLLAIILKKVGDFEGAMRAIEQAHIGNPADTNILLEKAQIYRDGGQIEIAVQASEELLNRSPGQPHACLIAGNYWLSQDFPERALERFDGGLAANPNHKTLAMGRIFALKDLCEHEQAWAAIEKLGSPPELFYTMGQIYMENFQTDLAVQRFQKSLEAGQNMSLAARDLWQCRFMMGGREALDEAIQDVLSQYPDRAEFYLQIADMMTELGDTERALQWIDRFEDRFGAQPAADRARAAAFEQAGETGKALKFARSALDQMPDDIGAAMYMAKALVAEGQGAQALQLAEAHLSSDKNQRSFWLAIKATALRLESDMDQYRKLVDYDRMLGVYDLDVPDGYVSRETFLSELRDHLMSLHEWNEQPLFQSLRKGTQTTRDLRHDQAPVMRAFFEKIDHCIRDYIGRMPADESHPFYGRRTRDYRMSGAWSVALKPGGFHVEHIHPKGWISSSFYVDVPDSVADHPEKAGWINFGKPPFDRAGLEAEKYICPKPGRLVLFPSYFWHGTVPFTEGEQRITLPFDLMPLD